MAEIYTDLGAILICNIKNIKITALRAPSAFYSIWVLGNWIS